MIIDAGDVPDASRSQAAIRLCDRNTGVGADGVEFLQWTGDRSGRITLYNADGSTAEISGNGTRCVAAWMAHTNNVPEQELLSLKTDAGIRECRVVRAENTRFEIASGMGVPAIRSATVVLKNGLCVEGAVVSMGNPHFVILTDNETFRVCEQEWQSVGREICFHPDFPRQTNVEFVHVRNNGEIEIRIFERGVGPTTSSGTGTCAAAAAAIALAPTGP